MENRLKNYVLNCSFFEHFWPRIEFIYCEELDRLTILIHKLSGMVCFEFNESEIDELQKLLEGISNGKVYRLDRLSK